MIFSLVLDLWEIYHVRGGFQVFSMKKTSADCFRTEIRKMLRFHPFFSSGDLKKKVPHVYFR